jgi:hypothetical protein
VAAEREEAGRFVMRADEKLTAFVEIGSAIRAQLRPFVRFCSCPVERKRGRISKRENIFRFDL